MELSRRKFFTGLGATSGALALCAPAVIRIPRLLMPIKALVLPTIYGDGVRDDTAGMMAAAAGLPFKMDGVAQLGGAVIEGKALVLTGPIKITGTTPFILRRSNIAQKLSDGDCFLEFTERAAPSEVTDCQFRSDIAHPFPALGRGLTPLTVDSNSL